MPDSSQYKRALLTLASVSFSPDQKEHRGLFYLLDAANLAALQPDFNPVRMICRPGQDSLNDPFGQFPGPLVLFQYDQDPQAGFDLGTLFSVQSYT